MTPGDAAALTPGDRVYRWVWIGLGNQHDLQVLTVVRVNRVTVTVETTQGSQMRLPPQDIDRYTEE